MSALAILVVYPWIALIVGGAFGVLWRYRPRRSVAAASLLWIGYAVYESLMYVRVLCSGECNIRVDLYLIYPALILVSLGAGVASLRRSST
jgi:hypothetical protein